MNKPFSQKEGEEVFDPDATQELPVPSAPEVVQVPGGGEMVFPNTSLEEVLSNEPESKKAPT